MGAGAGWLLVAGPALVTIATGAQALDNLAEFRAHAGEFGTNESWKVLRKEAWGALEDNPKFGGLVEGLIRGLLLATPLGLQVVSTISLAVSMRRRLKQLRADDRMQAANLARYLYLAGVWAIIMLGSAGVLVGAIILLLQAYGKLPT